MASLIEKVEYFEDYIIGANKVSHGRTIGEADILLHAGQTGDFYPHHSDAEWCQKHGFGQRVAHGTLTLSIGAGLLADVINPVAFSYGYERVRFIRPVFIGDTLHARSQIAGKRDDPKRPGNGFVDEECSVFNQSAETVLSFVHIYLVERRAENALRME